MFVLESITLKFMMKQGYLIGVFSSLLTFIMLILGNNCKLIPSKIDHLKGVCRYLSIIGFVTQCQGQGKEGFYSEQNNRRKELGLALGI